LRYLKVIDFSDFGQPSSHGIWIVASEKPDVPRLGNVNPPIGIDVGLEHFLSASDAE
jgi:hypothetical protein